MYGHKDLKLMDGGRKKWLDENRATTKDAPSPHRTTRRGRRTRSCAPSATRCCRRSASPAAPWSTSARPPSSPARSWRRPDSWRRPSAAATSPAPPTCPGRRRSRKTAPSSRRTSCAALRRQGHHGRQGRHRLLPHRRALVAHLVRAQAPARLPQRAQLRRLLDRMGQHDRRAGREALEARAGP